MGKKIAHVELHEGFFVPGLLPDAGGGQFGKSIPAAGKTLIDLDMTLNDNGSVEVSFGKGQSRTTLTIGAANIKYARHVTEKAKPVAKSE